MKVRIIHDYSRPRGSSVNDSISIDAVSFETVKSAYAYMRPGYFMAKVDLTKAYRSIPIHRSLWGSLAYQWGGHLYMDFRFPFGVKAAPGMFHRLTMAVSRWMKSQGFSGFVGYLDDFLIIAPTEEECLRGYALLIHFLRFLGLEANEAKCEPPCTSLTFLGICLSTDFRGMGVCAAYISEERLDRVASLCREVMAQGVVARRRLESLLGLLMFCAQVIHGATLYMRHGFALLARVQHSYHVIVTDHLRADLSWFIRLAGAHNGRAVVLDRRLVPALFFATDACTYIGFGGFLDGDYFAVTWEELALRQREPLFPLPAPHPTSHINYLELFAVYWALVKWGKRLSGMTVPIRVDNTVCEAMVRKLWGTETFIPLLKAIFLLCVRFDVRLSPSYIHTKANVLADALSRADWEVFRRERLLWRELAITERDSDDWQLFSSIVQELDVQFGPFGVDACCDEHGANSHFREHWHIGARDARLADWDRPGGLAVYCNPPFSAILQILLRFLICKCRSPVGTSAIFVLPVWDTCDFWLLVASMPRTFQQVRRYPAGSELFTAPVRGSATRRFCGPTHWDVVIVHCPPAAMTEEVDWVRWSPHVYAPPPT